MNPTMDPTMDPTMNQERLLFDNKGMPSKMRNLMLAFGIILIIIAVAGFIFILMFTRSASSGSGFSSETTIVNGQVVANISHKSGLRLKDGARTTLLVACGVILCLAAACFSVVISGRKFYFKIYDNHIEGRSGFGFLSKSVNLPIQQIGELSSNKLGLMPAIIIRTIHGNNVPVFMNADKIVQAEDLLRRMLSARAGQNSYT